MEGEKCESCHVDASGTSSVWNSWTSHRSGLSRWCQALTARRAASRCRATDEPRRQAPRLRPAAFRLLEQQRLHMQQLLRAVRRPAGLSAELLIAQKIQAIISQKITKKSRKPAMVKGSSPKMASPPDTTAMTRITARE